MFGIRACRLHDRLNTLSIYHHTTVICRVKCMIYSVPVLYDRPRINIIIRIFLSSSLYRLTLILQIHKILCLHKMPRRLLCIFFRIFSRIMQIKRIEHPTVIIGYKVSYPGVLWLIEQLFHIHSFLKMHILNYYFCASCFFFLCIYITICTINFQLSVAFFPFSSLLHIKKVFVLYIFYNFPHYFYAFCAFLFFTSNFSFFTPKFMLEYAQEVNA